MYIYYMQISMVCDYVQIIIIPGAINILWMKMLFVFAHTSLTRLREEASHAQHVTGELDTDNEGF